MRIFSKVFSSLFSEHAIERPALGYLNLKGQNGETFVNEDKKAFADLFKDILESNAASPKCHVLLIYADVHPNGSIASSPLGLAEIIKNSGAVIVIFATDNKAGNYMNVNAPGVNLVLTLQRKGDFFPKFFRKLFGLMFEGLTMPIAWSKLVPQGAAKAHAQCPDTIFSCEAGQVRFRK